ncbi:MAG TPA: hypothetical protein VJK72_00370, partial [Candidatus Nanoarchaeia archaeon]|nr:hypothetical protein [Candidatus Nanoarchaeia archaeon]
RMGTKKRQHPHAMRQLRAVLPDLPIIGSVVAIKRGMRQHHLVDCLEWTDVAVDMPFYDPDVYAAALTWLKRYEAAHGDDHSFLSEKQWDCLDAICRASERLHVPVEDCLDVSRPRDWSKVTRGLPSEHAPSKKQYLHSIMDIKGLMAELFVALRVLNVVDNGLVVRGYVCNEAQEFNRRYEPVEIDVIAVAPKFTILDVIEKLKSEYKERAQVSPRVYDLLLQ